MVAKSSKSQRSGPSKNGTKDLSVFLSDGERVELDRCRKIVRKGLNTFLDVGHALLAIQEQRLYRETHLSFESFCRSEFEMARSYAYRLIDSAKIVNELSPIGDSSVLPTNESQVRALSLLPTPEKRREVWQKAIEASSAEKAPVTASNS